MIEAINSVVGGSGMAIQQQSLSASVNSPITTGFSEVMTQLATATIGKIEQAEQVSIAKMAGAEIPLREVVDKVMAANQALNTTLAIRDKIVQAYIEVSHTQI